MKKLILMLNLIIATIVYCENIDIVPNWNIGDEIKLEYFSKRLRTYNNKVVLDRNYKENIVIKINDNINNGYKLMWKSEIDFENSEIFKQNIEFKDLFEKLQLINFEIITDEYGAFVDINNWEEVRDNTLKILDNIINHIDLNNKSEQDKNDTKIFFENFKKMFSTKENIINLAFKNEILFFSLNGNSFEIDSIYSFYCEIENAFGGNPIPAIGTISIEKINDSIVRIHIIQKLDKIKSSDLIVEMVKNLLAGTDIKEKMDLENEIKKIKDSINIEDTITFDYNTESCIPEKIVYERKIETQYMKQVDTEIIIQIKKDN